MTACRAGALLAATLFLVGSPPAEAAVRSWFTAEPNNRQGTLRVEGDDAADSIVVGCVGGQVVVNAAPPDSGALECGRVKRIEAVGGAGSDQIDLGSIAPAQADGIFRGVAASALVDGGAGDDVIVGPSGGLVRIVGGPGSDWMSGRALDTYVFAPADLPEHDTIVEPVNPKCEPSYYDSNQPGRSYWTVPWDAADFRTLAPGDPISVDENAPGGVFALHRNRTVSLARSGQGRAIEAIAGGPGSDRIAAACMAVGGAGDDVLVGTAADGDLLLGGEGSDELSGGDGIDALHGGPGVDTIDGGKGQDALVGGPGDDLLRGGPGGDTYVFGAADGGQADRVDEAPGAGVDVLSLDLRRDAPIRADLSTRSGVVARAPGLEVRVKPGTARYVEGVIGGDGNDRLTGNGARNHFWSGGGTDLLSGGRGDDVYHVEWTSSMPYGAYAWNEYWSGPFERSEAGRFTGIGEESRSMVRIDERAGGGFDTVDLAEGRGLEGQLAGARIDLSGEVWIVRTPKVRALVSPRGGTRHLEGVRGTSYADVLIGNRANNLLDGGRGRDRILGGRGRDTCVLGRDERDAHRSCERLRRAG